MRQQVGRIWGAAMDLNFRDERRREMAAREWDWVREDALRRRIGQRRMAYTVARRNVDRAIARARATANANT